MKAVIWILAVILGSVAFPQQPVRSYLPPATSSATEPNLGSGESPSTFQQLPTYEKSGIPENSQDFKGLKNVEMKEGLQTNGGRLYLPPGETPKMPDIEIINAEKEPVLSENTVESSSEGLVILPTSEAQEELTSALPDSGNDKKMTDDIAIDSDSNSLDVRQKSDSNLLPPDSKTTTEENESTLTAVEERKGGEYIPTDVGDVTTERVESSGDTNESLRPEISSAEPSDEAETFKTTTKLPSEGIQSNVPEPTKNQNESPDKVDQKKESLEVTAEGPYPYPPRTSQVTENNIEETTDSATRQCSSHPDELMDQTTKLTEVEDSVPVLMPATDKSLLTSDADTLDSQETLESTPSPSKPISSSQEETGYVIGKNSEEAYDLQNNGNHVHSLDDSNALHGGGMNDIVLSEPDSRGEMFERTLMGESGPVYYEFSYAVYDPPSGLDFGHQERRQGDNTEGRYYVVLPGGSRQVVTYIADQRGYRPVVRYDGSQQTTGRNSYTSSPSNQYPQQVASGDNGGLQQNNEYERTAPPPAFNTFGSSSSTSSTNNHVFGARPLVSSNFVDSNTFNGYP